MLKVIGAGLARTGTTSTKGALEDLGFGPCYTYATMFQRPDDNDFWLEAYADRTKINWEDLFSIFHSTVDWPACDFFEEHMRLYPDAPVILTIRDGEGWYKSMTDTIYDVHQAELAAGKTAENSVMVKLRDVMMWDGAFHGKFLDKDYAIAFFNRHNDHVKATVPADRLLVFDVKQGWEPLCKFLNVPVPDKPFPHLNDTQAFKDRVIEFRKLASWSK